MSLLKALFLCCQFLMLSVLAGAGEPAANVTLLQAIWTEAADSNLLAAGSQFDDLSGQAREENTLTEVIIGMGRPPISVGDNLKYQSLLKEIVKREGKEPEVALYLLGRLNQAHPMEPNFKQAFFWYGELVQRNEESHWAQLALVKMGLMTLYPQETTGTPKQRMAAADRILARISEDALRRDLSLQIGWAGLYYDRPVAEVVPYLIVADNVGGLLGITPEDLTIQIGELAFRMGDRQLAQRYFRRFLRQYPSSIRRYNVEQRLREIEQVNSNYHQNNYSSPSTAEPAVAEALSNL